MNDRVTLSTILALHAQRYPLMEPGDAVKLIFQNEFGGGHFVKDEASALLYLCQEHAGLSQRSGELFVEDIGNGYVRLHLRAVNTELLPLEKVNKAFVESSQEREGNLTNFLVKLDILREATRQGTFAFGSEALEEYLVGYARLRYPAVSHSTTYRREYWPAYRVLLGDKLVDLGLRIGPSL